MARKPPTEKELYDAKKIQAIAEALDSNDVSDEQVTRKKLFNKKVVPPSLAKRKRLRAAQDAINDETLIPKSPNPLADMARALHRCFQCGCTLTANEIDNMAVIEQPGLIVLCLNCFHDIQLIQEGDTSIILYLPYAATVDCAEAYEKLTSDIN